MPPAPERFSTTTDCPHLEVSFAASVRAVMSVPPPGENGTMKVTDFAGHDCATAHPIHTRLKNRDRPRFIIAALYPTRAADRAPRARSLSASPPRGIPYR